MRAPPGRPFSFVLLMHAGTCLRGVTPPGVRETRPAAGSVTLTPAASQPQRSFQNPIFTKSPDISMASRRGFEPLFPP